MTYERAKKLGLRPCLVSGKKGYFHKWDEICSPVVVSSESGAEQYKRTFALVELEDGTVERYEADLIQFLDTNDDLSFTSLKELREIVKEEMRHKYD